MEERECECGFIVKGSNQSQLKTNMRAHLEGKRHKDLMEIKKRREQKKLHT